MGVLSHSELQFRMNVTPLGAPASFLFNLPCCQLAVFHRIRSGIEFTQDSGASVFTDMDMRVARKTSKGQGHFLWLS